MNKTVKAVILDIDGVLIGEKIGFNAPNPHPFVLSMLKKTQDKGIPIVLCTAKPHFAIQNIIEPAHLDNFHITDGGGVVIDPINKKVLSLHCIESDLAQKILKCLLDNDVYTEIYTIDNYFIQSSQKGLVTDKHKIVLQLYPEQAVDLLSKVHDLKVTKIMPISNDNEGKLKIQKLLEPFKDQVVVSWGVHPIILPLQFGIITTLGISKSIAAEEILKNLAINPSNTLGVGDSTSDWQFMSHCGYAAAMGNASDELKLLVSSKAENSYIGPSVNENGIIDIFQHFGL